MCVSFLYLSIASAPAFQVDFTLGRPQKQMQISPQTCYLGRTELHEMEKQQWEMLGNLSSSYTTVINFKVFMTKVCMSSLFSIKMSSNSIQKKAAVVFWSEER